MEGRWQLIPGLIECPLSDVTRLVLQHPGYLIAPTEPTTCTALDRFLKYAFDASFEYGILARAS